MAVLLLGALGALVALFPRQIASIFTSDPEVLDEFVKVRLPLAATVRSQLRHLFGTFFSRISHAFLSPCTILHVSCGVVFGIKTKKERSGTPNKLIGCGLMLAIRSCLQSTGSLFTPLF